METRHQLRAWMRYDSLSRAVAGSLIYSKDRPKVGNWREIAARQSGSITTTSTTSTTTTEFPISDALKLTFINYEEMTWLVTDPYNVDDWNFSFDLPAHGNPFTSLWIDDNKVYLVGGSNITLLDNLFNGYFLTGIEDPNGCIVYSEDASLSDTSLTDVYLPALTNIPTACFTYSHSLVSVHLPAATICEYIAFDHCINLSVVNLPLVTSIGDEAFQDCHMLSSINIPSCTNLGSTVGNNSVFYDNTGAKTITLTIPSALMTCNSGQPDGDIQYLVANNDVTIVQV